MRASLWAAAVFLCVTARGGAAGPAVKNPDSFVYLTAGEVMGLDPAVGGNGLDHQIILNVYDTLFSFDSPAVDHFAPSIAARIPSRANGLISADGTAYTIPIRKGVVFHDGAPLTPEDVRYSILRFMLGSNGNQEVLLEPLSGYRSLEDAAGKLRESAYRDADRAVRVEGGRIVLRLPRPFAPLLAIFARWCPIVSKRWAVAHGDWDGTEASWKAYHRRRQEDSPFIPAEDGSGPFALERWDRSNREVVLVRNDRYWRGAPKIKRVYVRTVPEVMTRRLMIAAGDADAAEVDLENADKFRGIPGVEVIDDLASLRIEPEAHFCVKIDSTANPYIGSGKLDGDGVPPDFFADRDVRLGFADAFDYDGYIRDVLRGRGKRSHGFIPPGFIGYAPSLEFYRFDPEKAREHLRRAWGGRAWEKGFRFSLIYAAGNGVRQVAAQMLARSVESLNPKFKIELRPLVWSAYLGALDANKIPLVIFGEYALYADPNALTDQQFDPGNPCQYDDPEAGRVIRRAVAAQSRPERERLYRRLLELERDDVPQFEVANAPGARVQRTWVKGWYANPMLPAGYFASIEKSPVTTRK